MVLAHWTRAPAWLTAVLATLLAGAAPAAAQEDPCARGTWVLSGASSQPDDGRAVFVPEWNHTLEVVAGCLQREPLADACLVVRGLTDEMDFSPPLARAFGSPEAVQLARGQGRAMAVQARLEALGAPAHRLRMAAGTLGSGTRGAELRLVRGCMAPPPREQLGRPEVEALVDQRVSLALAAAAASSQASEPAPEPAPRPAPPPRQPVSPPPEWFDTSLDLTVLGFHPDTVVAPVLSFGAGLERRGFIGRGVVGLVLGSTPEEQVGLEASVYGGRRLSPTLELGLELRYRITSFDHAEPWLDQALGAGVRAATCPAALARPVGLVCFSADVLPLGARWRRGQVRGGGVVAVPITTDYAVTVAIGAELRWPAQPEGRAP
jgi:hypothetical protein